MIVKKAVLFGEYMMREIYDKENVFATFGKKLW